eukprot:TRINITY_DN43677_c0_g1_i1.p2 TRINITY_DN43677_c0_g1~~TRINITY_DN43677_c0_g1_i1.p2  ORF type:complete len:240 (-),score=40.95 TRINITY_DN43677_c0_g1_i1:279-998(-)
MGKAGGRRLRILRAAWERRLVPGEPVELPRLAESALRLSTVVLDDAVPGASDEVAAELQLLMPTGADQGGTSTMRQVTVSRLCAANSPGSAPVARVRALLSCSEGVLLVASGRPLHVFGRLEGALRPLECQKAMPSSSKPSVAEVEKPRKSTRPRDLKEFVEHIKLHLRNNGRTSLRRLGTAVQLPPGVPTGRLKRVLLQHRDKFIVDLFGCVEINHSKRWRWRGQALVTKRRKVPSGR